MAKQPVDMWGPFKTVALFFGGAALIASLGAGTIAPLVITGVAVCILAKVFNALGKA